MTILVLVVSLYVPGSPTWSVCPAAGCGSVPCSHPDSFRGSLLGSFHHSDCSCVTFGVPESFRGLGTLGREGGSDQSMPASLQRRYRMGCFSESRVGQIHPRRRVSSVSAAAISRPDHRSGSTQWSLRASQTAPICSLVSRHGACAIRPAAAFWRLIERGSRGCLCELSRRRALARVVLYFLTEVQVPKDRATDWGGPRLASCG